MPVQAEWEAERSGHLTEGGTHTVNSQMGFQGEDEETREMNARHGSQRSERGAVQQHSDARAEPGQLAETELQSPESQEEPEDLAGDMGEPSETAQAHSQIGFHGEDEATREINARLGSQRSERGAVQQHSDARAEPGQLDETELHSPQSQEEPEDLAGDMVEPSETTQAHSQIGFHGEDEATREINARHGSQRSERGAVQQHSDARAEPGQLDETELHSPQSGEEPEDLAGDMVEPSETTQAHSQIGFHGEDEATGEINARHGSQRSERGAVQRSDARAEPGRLDETELHSPQSQEELEDLSDDMVEPSPEPGELVETELRSPENQEVENRHGTPHAEVFQAVRSEQENRFISSLVTQRGGAWVKRCCSRGQPGQSDIFPMDEK